MGVATHHVLTDNRLPSKPVNPACLTVIPSVPVWTSGATLVFDRKFYDGLMRYVDAWPGRVRVLMWRAEGPDPSFGNVRAARHELPFDLVTLAPTEGVTRAHLAPATVVLAAADDHRQLHVASLCRSMGIRCAYVIEYVPETRHQINGLEAPNRWVRWRRDLFLRRRERARRRALDRCDALQANGMPAFEHYQPHPNSLLYFDTRVQRDTLIPESVLEARLLTLNAARPLNLAFSGRLISMKGADHLIEVAHRLQQRGIPFTWTIYGSGELETTLRARVHWLGLTDTVHLPGAVDFERELLPTIQRSCDLYVMLHRQSDPSCTYMETMACGIPILGYDNRALRGLLRLVDAGETVPMDDIDAVVDALAHLHANRGLLMRRSRAAREFAARHAFEDTFQRRVGQLLGLTGAA